MKKRMIQGLAVVAAAAAFSVPGTAQSLYVYGDVSRSDVDIDGFDDDDSGVIGVGLGYRINENFAIEAGYQDIGEISASAGGASADIEGDAVQLAVLSQLPVSENAALHLRVGLDFWDVDLDYDNVPGFGSGSVSDDGNDVYFGLGASATISENLQVYFDYELHEWDDVDIDLIGLGLQFSFGQ